MASDISRSSRRALASAVAVALVVVPMVASPSVLAADPVYFACANGGAYLSSPAVALTVAQGQTAVFTIDIHRTSCPDSIDFTFFDNTLPAGTPTTFSENPTTADEITLTVKTSNAWPGPTPLTTYGLQLDPDTGHTYPGTYLILELTVVASVAPIATTPTPRLVTGSTIGSTSVPVRTSWSAIDPDGIARYTVQRQTGGGSWRFVALSSATARSITQSLSYGVTYRYRVRATDKLGHTGAFAYGPSFSPRLVQQTSTAIKSAWHWTTVYTSAASGGSLRYEPYSGGDFTYSFTALGVAWVAAIGPNRCNVCYVRMDGVPRPAALNLTAPSTAYRRVVFAQSFGSSAKHTLYVQDLAYIGHSRIDIDAFVLLIQR